MASLLFVALIAPAAVLGCPALIGKASGPLHGAEWLNSCHACLNARQQGCAFVWRPSPDAPAPGTSHTYDYACKYVSGYTEQLESDLQAAADTAKQRAYYQSWGDCRDERQRQVVEPKTAKLTSSVGDDWQPVYMSKPSVHDVKEQMEAVEIANKKLDQLMTRTDARFQCTAIKQGKVPDTLRMRATPVHQSTDQYFIHGTTTQGLHNIAVKGLLPMTLDKLPELGTGFYTAASVASGVSVMATIHRRCDRTEHALHKDSKESDGVRQFGTVDDKTGPIIGIFRARRFWDEANTMLFYDGGPAPDLTNDAAFPQTCARVWRPGSKVYAPDAVRNCRFTQYRPRACYFLQLDGDDYNTHLSAVAKTQLFTTDNGRSKAMSAVNQMKINEECYDQVELVGYFKFHLACRDLIRMFGHGPGLREQGGPADWALHMKLWTMVDKCVLPNTI